MLTLFYLLHSSAQQTFIEILALLIKTHTLLYFKNHLLEYYTKSVNNEENANKITLTGQDESGESKKPAAAPEDEARKEDVSDVRRDLLRIGRMLLRSSRDQNHLRLLCLQ